MAVGVDYPESELLSASGVDTDLIKFPNSLVTIAEADGLIKYLAK